MATITENSPAAARARRPRQDKRRARNRARLLDAAKQVLVELGSGGFTVAEITRRAGMDPPAFYPHFKNAQECMEVVAAEMFTKNREAHNVGRRFLFQKVDYSAAAQGPDYFLPHVRAALHGWLAERRVAEIFLRCRYDDSAMGEAIRDVLAQSRVDFADDLAQMAQRLGFDERGQMDLLGEQILSMSLNAAESLIEGRQTDVDQVAALLARSIYHMVRGEFLRLMAERNADS